MTALITVTEYWWWYSTFTTCGPAIVPDVVSVVVQRSRGLALERFDVRDHDVPTSTLRTIGDAEEVVRCWPSAKYVSVGVEAPEAPPAKP
jgi:hypothetical protein